MPSTDTDVKIVTTICVVAAAAIATIVVVTLGPLIFN